MSIIVYGPDLCIEECQVEVKSADLENACLIDHQFTEYIQTGDLEVQKLFLGQGMTL